MTTQNTTEFKQMTLSECAKFDHDNKLKEKLTGWGMICKDRAAKKLSKRGNARRARRGK